ncbi:MAG: TIGR04348 family glycosyltransferase [Burkholderiales bacterium]|nr:TIGR04348 family glycosyltransferase [Burkholderiales bacterium]
MTRPKVLIVTPAVASSNNGNWQTAWRWSRMLSGNYATRIALEWRGEEADLLVALHARRSAGSIHAWADARPRRPLAVVLTGTDLYRDIAVDARAQDSLQLADRLVVLQELGGRVLTEAQRRKTAVIFQSTPARRALAKPVSRLRALMVGHLRDEKSPETYFAAARLLAGRPDILLDHIGAPLDARLGDAARECMAACPNYRWLGALDHEATRRRIQRAHVLVHASRMEGGAHVVMEAVRSGTPVIASRIDGNRGMLGKGYAGCFAWGAAHRLAALLVKCRVSQGMADGFLAQLAAQCRARAALFEPAREKSALIALVRQLLGKTRIGS